MKKGLRRISPLHRLLVPIFVIPLVVLLMGLTYFFKHLQEEGPADNQKKSLRLQAKLPLVSSLPSQAQKTKSLQVKSAQPESQQPDQFSSGLKLDSDLTLQSLKELAERMDSIEGLRNPALIEAEFQQLISELKDEDFSKLSKIAGDENVKNTERWILALALVQHSNNPIAHTELLRLKNQIESRIQTALDAQNRQAISTHPHTFSEQRLRFEKSILKILKGSHS